MASYYFHPKNHSLREIKKACCAVFGTAGFIIQLMRLMFHRGSISLYLPKSMRLIAGTYVTSKRAIRRIAAKGNVPWIT